MDTTRQVIKHKRSINLVLRTIGNTLIIIAIFFLALGFWPYIDSEFNYDWNQLVGQRFLIAGDKATVSSSPLGAIVSAPPPISITPSNTDFTIIIPKINVNSPVVANVDPTNYNEYMQALNKGVAHAKGSVYPGQEGNSYIFAHSTLNFWDIGRYDAVFTLLGKLDQGDLIVLFYHGQRYDYYVTLKKTVDANDVSDLTAYAQGKQLTLQTCDPPGLNLRRLLVIAKER